jgi:hypothetical protein
MAEPWQCRTVAVSLKSFSRRVKNGICAASFSSKSGERSLAIQTATA